MSPNCHTAEMAWQVARNALPPVCEAPNQGRAGETTRFAATRPGQLSEPSSGGSMDTGYAAWMLTASSIVLMMTAPGLALFYGGLTRSKSVLNMMMMSYSALGIVGVVYVLWGWSMSFSDLWSDTPP